MTRCCCVLDMEKQFAFHSAHHSNPTNVLLHTLTVWPIFFTGFLLFYFTPTLTPLHPLVASHLPAPIADTLVLNVSFVVAVLYALFYVFLDVRAGSLAALLTLLCWAGSCVVGAAIGYAVAWKVVVAVQLSCWSIQLLGHALFEKRVPAILHYHFQTFLLAPLFSVLEILQKFFNYEPHPGFRAKVETKIQAEGHEFEDKKSS